MLRRLAIAPFLLAATAVAQDVCSCQPLSYTFTLDFSAVCEPGSRTTGGFSDTICFSEGGVPTSVTQIVIEEQNQDPGLEPINTITIDETFSDGDSFSFDSILAQSSDPALIPGGLLVEMTGTNEDGDTVSNTWVAIFSNDCSIFPVLAVGDGFGWTSLVRTASWGRLRPADLSYCVLLRFRLLRLLQPLSCVQP